MGRTFENRKHAILKRGARDSKAFTRCGRQISMAVKSGGGDPDTNPALRRAMQNASAANMSKEKVKNAIDKALKLGDTSNFEQVLYEGYGPHGVAMIVDTATDNPTRTVANVRSAFKKGLGNLGNTGSVSFMFDQSGVFKLKPEGIERDELELELIDHGLEELADAENDKGEAQLLVRCTRENFGTMQTALEAQEINVESSGFEWIPQTLTELTDEQVDDVLKLIARLDDDDDVQEVFHTLA
ncbi:MAG: YebC/PmpR family DNA-binding transcriptional regulator [Myxococcota bacterium]|nr:YebC/PmpR family DNA-binding transcriptional regulator [Myxococcota bacterium]